MEKSRVPLRESKRMDLLWNEKFQLDPVEHIADVEDFSSHPDIKKRKKYTSLEQPLSNSQFDEELYDDKRFYAMLLKVI